MENGNGWKGNGRFVLLLWRGVKGNQGKSAGCNFLVFFLVLFFPIVFWLLIIIHSVKVFRIRMVRIGQNTSRETKS